MDPIREIGTIARALDSIANSEFQEIDLTKGQYLYLVRVLEKPGIILEEISERLKVDRATASRAVNKLVAKGFLIKKSLVDNRKNKQIYATDLGKSVGAFVLREHAYSRSVALQGFTDEEAQQITELLVRMRENIEIDWQTVKKGLHRSYESQEEAHEG